MSDDKVQLAVRVSPDKRQMLRLCSATSGRSINEMVQQAIDDVLAREVTGARSKAREALAG